MRGKKKSLEFTQIKSQCISRINATGCFREQKSKQCRNKVRIRQGIVILWEENFSLLIWQLFFSDVKYLQSSRSSWPSSKYKDRPAKIKHVKRKSDFFADHIDVMGTKFPLSERRPKRIDVQKHHFVNANEIVGVPGSKQFLKQNGISQMPKIRTRRPWNCSCGV